MFGLFRKKTAGINTIDTVWISEAYKFKALAKEWATNNETVFVAWFEESLRNLEALLQNSSPGPFHLLIAREVSRMHTNGKPVIFIEHYPLAAKEDELFQKLELKEVKVWSALDEPLFHRFGGEKIIRMMKQLGMKEEEPIEHSMISKAIRNAQQKIAAKLTVEQSARSQKDWLIKNIPV